jgi:serine phosphatase RsbU (regulator of sigma subunit)
MLETKGLQAMTDVELTGAVSRDDETLRLLERILSDGSLLRGALDLIADAVAHSLAVPVALVSLVGRERQHFLGQHGLAGEVAAGTPLSHSFCQHVALGGETLVIDKAIEHPLVCDNPAIQDLGVEAYAGQPIVVAGFVLGSMCAIDTAPRHWTEQEVVSLRAFADLAQYLINARLETVGQLRDQRAGAHARDREQSARLAVYEALANEQTQVESLNRRLQHALLPRPSAQCGVEVDIFYQPGSDRLLLGGDFVDTAPVGEGELAFVIGDVVGHGPEAAALAISLRASWHALQSVGTELSRIVEVLDAMTADASLYATALVGTITRDGQLTLISAGHPAPIAAGDQGVREVPDDPGPMLGLGLKAPRWEVTQTSLSGQTLLAYTDGLVEGTIHHSRERFGITRLLATIADQGPEPELLCRAASAANDEPLSDDVAILRIHPA